MHRKSTHRAQRFGCHAMTVETIALLVVSFVVVSYIGGRVAIAVNAGLARAASAISTAK